MTIRNKINGLKEIWQFDNRWQLIASRLLFSKENIDIYRYRGMEILIDHSAGDANGAREVLTSPMYRRYIAQMELPGGSNILDIGANNGGFPLLLKSEGVAIKKLVSVELNPQTFSRMRFNIERNFDCEFVGINGAVCGSHREIDISLGSGGAGDSIYEQNSAGVRHRMQGYTFDEIYEMALNGERIDLCKIDIEGAEFEIFANSGHGLIKKCRNLLMEIHEGDGRSRETIRAVLSGLGFKEIGGETKNNEDHHVHFFVNQS
jgi:FkbM family methyltransferase